MIEPPAPLRRACHSAGVVGRSIYLVGGRYWDMAEDDYIFLNDIQVLGTAPSSTLATDWSKLINSKDLSDVTLVVGSRSYYAHRVVLAARCEYFRLMLLSGMREADQTEISLPLDVFTSEEVFEKLLEHIYTDTDDIPSALALDLFTAAAYFQLERLKQMCLTRVESEMSVETVCHILSVAEQHSAPRLKEEAVKFIVAHFRQVHKTDGFKDLERHLLDLVHDAISARLAGVTIDS